MRLSPLDDAILASACFDAECSHAKIAKQVRSKTHTVQYTLSKYKRAGLLQDFVAIDLGAAGLTCYSLFLSLNLSASSRDRFVQLLLKHPAINFVTEYLGAFQFGCGVLTEHSWQAHAVLASIAQRSNAIVTKKSLSTRWRITEIKRKASSDTSAPQLLQFYGPSATTTPLSKVDWETLGALSEFPEQGTRELAQTLRLPFATLYSRLQGLRERKIFLRRMYLPDLQQLGFCSAKLLIYGRGVNPPLAAKLREHLLAHRCSHHLVETFGAWEYEVNVSCQSAEEVLRIREDLAQRFSSYVERIEVLLTTRTLKRACFPGTQFARQMAQLGREFMNFT